MVNLIINLNEPSKKPIDVLGMVASQPGLGLSTANTISNNSSSLSSCSRFLLSSQTLPVSDEWIPYDENHRPYAEDALIAANLVSDEDWDYLATS